MRAVQSLRAVHPATAKVEYLLVKEEKFRQEDGDLSVIVGAIEQGDLVVDALRKEPVFEKVELRPTRRTKDERWEIPVTLKIVEKSAEPAAAEDAPAKDGAE
jgi:hypothetical protein